MAIARIDESQIPPFWVTIMGLGGCGVHQVDVLQREFGHAFKGLHLRYFAVDSDSAPGLSHSAKRPTVPWVYWRWGEEPYHLCPQSCHGDAALARGSDWKNVKADIAVCFDLATTDVLILLVGWGKGAGTGISQALAAQARLAGKTVFVLAALPFQSETSPIGLSVEMRRLESVCDAVLYFDQEHPTDGTFMTQSASLGECMRITDRRMQDCFHELLKGMTCAALQTSMHVPDVSRCFIQEGRCGYGHFDANVAKEIPEALSVALQDAHQMTGRPALRHGFIRVAHPRGVERDVVWKGLTSALDALPISQAMAFDKSVEVDASLVNKIAISVFVA